MRRPDAERTAPAGVRTAARLGRLELRAKAIVEGAVSGLHKSPHHGFSVEFVQHKPYVPGDEVRHVDWRVYGRTDRFYVRQFEQETNTSLVLVCDLSGSMGWGGKDRTAKELAAALAWLAVRQNDAAGLLLAAGGRPQWFAPSAKPARFRHLVRVLERARPEGRPRFGEAVAAALAGLRRRGIFAVVSDFWDGEELLSALEEALFRRHEVIAFRVESPEEAEFPFRGMVRFEDLESGETVTVDAAVVRPAYLERRRAFRQAAERWAARRRVDIVDVRTDTAVEEVLRRYLVRRRTAAARS